MIVVDSLTTALGGGELPQSEMYFQQGVFAARARSFAEEFGVSVFVLMHITADSLRDGGENKPPTKAALRGAHAVADAATHILGTWRVPEEIKRKEGTERKGNHWYGVDNVLVLLKNRDRGDHVTARMGFDNASKRFYGFDSPNDKNRAYKWEQLEASTRVVTQYIPPPPPPRVNAAVPPPPPQPFTLGDNREQAPQVQYVETGDPLDDFMSVAFGK
jgi:hypothetical protein